MARTSGASGVRATCCVVILMVCCASALAAAPLPKRNELIEKFVEGASGPDAKGQYTVEHEGTKWAVMESKADDGAPTILFINTKAFSISYADPRTNKMIAIPEDIAEAGRVAFRAAPPPPPMKTQEDLTNGLPGDAEMDAEKRWFILDHSGVKHVVYKHADNGRFYFINTETQHADWVDPRRAPQVQDSGDDEYEDPDEAEKKTEL